MFTNKKTVLMQENREMRTCSFRFKVYRQHSVQDQEEPSFESRASEVQTYRHKTELNAKWPLRSFKVTCFGVSGKAIRDSVILYNNVGLVC